MTDRDASLEAAFAGEGATLRRLVDGFPLVSAGPGR
jgi:hypothetical protein